MIPIIRSAASKASGIALEAPTAGLKATEAFITKLGKAKLGGEGVQGMTQKGIEGWKVSQRCCFRLNLLYLMT